MRQPASFNHYKQIRRSEQWVYGMETWIEQLTSLVAAVVQSFVGASRAPDGPLSLAKVPSLKRTPRVPTLKYELVEYCKLVQEINVSSKKT